MNARPQRHSACAGARASVPFGPASPPRHPPARRLGADGRSHRLAHSPSLESTLNLEDLGWGEPFASAFAASEHDGNAPARVVAVHRGHLVVAGAQGEALAVVAGRGRERATIGAWVVVDARGAVSARLPRQGVLARAGPGPAADGHVAFVGT